MTQRSELERIHSLETDVTVLHRDSALHTKTLEKVEDVIDRLETHNEALSRTVSVYDEKFKNQERLHERLEMAMEKLEIKLDEHEGRMKAVLEVTKKEIIESVKPQREEHIPKRDLYRFKIFKFFIDNWKVFAYIVAFLAGIMFHKWGLLASLLGFGG
jgi:hypothetical protein